MSVDDTLQPEEPAHPYDSSTPEAAGPATTPPESTPILTDSGAGGVPATAVAATPSPAPHTTPAIDVDPTGQPLHLQPDQTSSEPPAPVDTGISQPAPTPPPAATASPAASGTPTLRPAATSSATHLRPQQQRSRGCGLLASISVICIIALLASGTYLLFTLLSSHTEGDAARVAPFGTVALISVDLVAAAAHSHRITASDLAPITGQGDTFTLLTGLEWDKDILPWVGRNVAFSVFQRPLPYNSLNGSQSTATASNNTLGNAILLQSRDDGASQAAMRKAAKYQQTHGLNVVTLDYHGLILYHTSLLQGDESGTTLAAGKGWAIVASDLPAARKLVDNLTGNSSASDTLAANGAYHTALSTLPANRFGTIFLNTRALVKSFVYSASTQIDMASTFANTYPTATGYLTWTSGGLRAQLTFPSTRSIDIGSLAGNTTTLANLTPADAFAYFGVANLGAALSLQTTLTLRAKVTAGTATSFFSLMPSDPALQQPAALSLISEPDGATGFLTLLNAPDQADALAMLQQSAEQQHWTSQTVKIAGVSATAYYEKLPPAQDAMTTTAGIETTGAAPVPAARLVGMATWQKDTLIVASDATVLASAIHTIREHAPNLAQDTRFQQLLREAPGNGCATTFLDLSRAATADSTPASVLAASLAGHIPAIFVTHMWTSDHYQATADVLLLN